MNFSQLKAELVARGFDYLPADRVGLLVNQARQQLDDLECWPYRETSVLGVAPVLVADLGIVEHVIDATNDVSLTPMEFGTLSADYGLLDDTGQSPWAYYLGQPNNGPGEVATFPVSNDLIGVQYWRVTPDLVADADVPAAPSQYHQIIIDLAVQRAYIDRDNFQAAMALQPLIDSRVAEMRVTLLSRQRQEPFGQQLLAWSEDW